MSETVIMWAVITNTATIEQAYAMLNGMIFLGGETAVAAFNVSWQLDAVFGLEPDFKPL